VDCRWTAERIGAHRRGGLSHLETRQVDAHLASCAACRVLRADLAELDGGLRGVLATIVLGGSAGAYLGQRPGPRAVAGGVLVGVRGRAGKAAAAIGAAAAVTVLALLATTASAPLDRDRASRSADSGGTPVDAGAPPPGAATPSPAVAATSSPAPGTRRPGDRGRGTSSPPASEDAPADRLRPVGAPPAGSAAVAVSLEPAGALVRGRPGVLVVTVANHTANPAANETASPAADRSIAAGGGAAAPAAAPRRPAPEPTDSAGPADPTGPADAGASGSAPGFAPPATVPRRAAAPATGPLVAELALPTGVTLRGADAGDGWRCTSGEAGVRCTHGSLAPGRRTRAYVPVTVAADARPEPPAVRVSGPTTLPATRTAAAGPGDSGRAAVVAGSWPASVQVGGNTLLSCWTVLPACAAARADGGGTDRTGTTDTADGTDNDDQLMAPYSDPRAPEGRPAGTAVSGATVPLAGRVMWAGLYWAGSGAAPDAPVAYLRGPGSSRYTAVRAGRVDTSEDDASPGYQASADVTGLVRQGGTWWVAVAGDAFATPARGAFGGWSLVVVVADGGAPRQIAVLDGFTPLDPGDAYTVRVPGPGDAGVGPASPSPARVGLVAWEGDRGLRADRMTLGGRPLGGPDEDPDNVAASRAAGTPAGWTTFGVDARVLAGTAGPGATSALRAVTRQDAFLLGPLAVEVPS
jgi:hypothetical protein